MHKLKSFVKIAGLAALVSVALPVWAESAPVFDADTYDAGAADGQGQDLSMQPAPAADEAVATAAPQESGDPAIANNPSPVIVGGTAQNGVVSGGNNTAPAVANAAPPTSAGVTVSTDNLTPEQRVRRLEQQLANLQSSEGTAQVETLQTEVQSLRGQIETMNHELEKLRAQQQKPVAVDKPATSARNDTDDIGPTTITDDATAAKRSAAKKTKALPVAAVKTTTADASASKDQPNVAEEQKIYQTAYDLIKAKKYSEAVTALQGMLKKYPSGQFASNAHYWLGELYGLMSKNGNALDEFNTVITKFPGSPRVSDAQLKVGLILAAQSKWPDAKKAFKQVINTYPGTASSRLASEQLKQIKLAGH